MVWFRIDDQWANHPKVRKAGGAGRMLWVMAGVQCSAAMTNGVVDGELLEDYGYLADLKTRSKALAAAQALVRSGLWHDVDTVKDCANCKHLDAAKLEPGSYLFHDWLLRQPDKASKASDSAKAKEARKRRLLNDSELRQQIYERDGDLCRYCGRRVNWVAKTGNAAGQHDHVDPDGDNTLENVVVACKKCNRDKGERTPEEWHADGGHLLRPPPGPYSPTFAEPSDAAPDAGNAEAAGYGSIAVQTTSTAPEHVQELGQEAGQGSGAESIGTGRDGSGPGPGTGRDGSRTGAGRTGSRRRGPGKAGGGPARDGPELDGSTAGADPGPDPDPPPSAQH